MTPEQQAAYIMAQTACAMGEMMAVQTQALATGQSIPLSKMEELMVKYGITHNQIISFFHHYGE